MLCIAVALIVAGITLELVKRYLDRPLTEWDEYCDRADQELDAQLACRPLGNVERI